VTQVKNQSKTVEVRIMQFPPYSSPTPLLLFFLWDKFHPEILAGSPELRRQTRKEWGKRAVF